MHGPETAIVLIVCLALASGAALWMLSRRIGFPFTLLMLLAGVAIGALARHFAHGDPEHVGWADLLASGSEISPDLILLIFLPALVFESAFAIKVHAFRRNLGGVVILAGPALVLATVATGALMVGLTKISWQWGLTEALVFGALISATDPVAVVALLKELGAPKRLSLLIEGESLLNDGTAIVVFMVLMKVLLDDGTDFSTAAALLDFVKVTGGGILVGLLLAMAVSHWLSYTFNAPLVEISLTILLAYAAMLVAESLHVSGVMALVVAGLWMSGPGRVQISPEVIPFLHRFWEMLSHLANTLIFLLVGMVIAGQVVGRQRADMNFGLDLLLIVLVYLAVMALRFGILFLSRPAINRVIDPVSPAETVVMAWGGLRGAVSLALGLYVSRALEASDPVLGDQVLRVTAGVVFLTIMVNGSTIAWLLRRLGLDRTPPGERLAELTVRASVLERIRKQIDEMALARPMRAVNWDDVRADLTARLRVLHEQIEQTRAELDAAGPDERAHAHWRQVLNMEREMYWTAFARGMLGARAAQILDHEIDLVLDRLAHTGRTPEEIRERDYDHLDMPALRPEGGADGKDKAGSAPGPFAFDRLALRYDLWRGEALAAERVLEELDSLPEIDQDVQREVRRVFRRYLHESRRRIEDLRANLPEVTRAIESRLALRCQLNMEREQYEALAASGAIEADVAEEALADVDRRMKDLRRRDRSMTLPDTADLVGDTPLFAGLTGEKRALLAKLTVERVLSPGDELFKEGERGESLFIIARGAVEVVRMRGERPERLDVVGGGEVLGEMALLTGEPRMATVRALTTVVLGEISREGFQKLADAQPELLTQVWAGFCRRRFDNHLRLLPRFEHLDQEHRVAWFEQGRVQECAAGETLSADEDGFLFVAVGTVDLDGETLEAPALRERRAGASCKVTQDARVVLLPLPPHETS